MIDRNLLYAKAYAVLNTAEIFKFDCGSICDKICCKDVFHPDCENGMRLLPDEEKYIGKSNFFRYKNNSNGTFLICGGKCNRAFRPFACRVFPYYPFVRIKKDGKIKITILPDPAAASICPILNGNFKVRRNIFHDRAIKQAVRILCKDEEIKKELLQISDFNREILLLRKKLF